MNINGGQARDDLSSMLILDDEDIAFLSSLHQGKSSQPISTDAPYEKKGHDADTSAPDISQFIIRPLFWDDPLAGIPSRIKIICDGAGITTFGGLLSVDLTTLSGVGGRSVESINHFFVKCADLTPSIYLPLSDMTKPIRLLSGNRNVIWGPFGQLHPLCSPLEDADLDASALITSNEPVSPVEPRPNGVHDEREECAELDVSIDLLDLPEPVLRRLQRRGYRTISDLDRAPDKELLSTRGFSWMSLDRVRDAI